MVFFHIYGSRATFIFFCDHQDNAGSPVEAGRWGAGRCAGNGDSQREEATIVQDNPWGLQGPGGRSRTENGGQTVEERQTQARVRNYLSWSAGEESAYERWRPAGRGAVQVDGRSAPGKYGGEKRVQREREAALKTKRWRAIGDRYGGEGETK